MPMNSGAPPWVRIALCLETRESVSPSPPKMPREPQTWNQSSLWCVVSPLKCGTSFTLLQSLACDHHKALPVSCGMAHPSSSQSVLLRRAIIHLARSDRAASQRGAPGALEKNQRPGAWCSIPTPQLPLVQRRSYTSITAGPRSPG